MISFDPPPNGFSTGVFYSSPLRIYWQGGRYWVYDGTGFLCSTDDEAQLRGLLHAQAERPKPDAPFGAREWLIPEAFLHRQELQRQSALAHTAVFGEGKPFPPRGAKPALSSLSLKDLGL